MEETDGANATEGASPASGPAASVLAPPSVTLSIEALIERRIVVPFVERSTRYAVL